MITLIIGRQNSGKSALAEDIAVSYEAPRYYLATMKIMDDEGRERVSKHRKLREGKGFTTIEVQYDLKRAVPLVSDINATVLLECIANLVGNELYDNKERPWKSDIGAVDGDRFVSLLMADVKYLADNVSNLVIVTNRYGTDGFTDDMTKLYISLLDKMNNSLCDLADRVIEV